MGPFFAVNVTDMYRDVQKVFGHCVIFYHIFHIKPHFLKTLFPGRLLFDVDDFFINKGRIKCSLTL